MQCVMRFCYAFQAEFVKTLMVQWTWYIFIFLEIVCWENNEYREIENEDEQAIRASNYMKRSHLFGEAEKTKKWLIKYRWLESWD